uniref:Putative secreted protein n=1 Tax=Anopheles marajoara TaxID=58244 RepID=A0A2M4C8P3_9DIPT
MELTKRRRHALALRLLIRTILLIYLFQWSRMIALEWAYTQRVLTRIEDISRVRTPLPSTHGCHLGAPLLLADVDLQDHTALVVVLTDQLPLDIVLSLMKQE